MVPKSSGSRDTPDWSRVCGWGPTLAPVKWVTAVIRTVLALARRLAGSSRPLASPSIPTVATCFARLGTRAVAVRFVNANMIPPASMLATMLAKMVEHVGKRCGDHDKDGH